MVGRSYLNEDRLYLKPLPPLLGHRRIAQIGNQMKMSDRQIESAQRYFNLAVIENFTKGRKANSVACACLYIVCRLEKTSHMLIDFSEHLRVSHAS
jgi:transcription factor IIIB subunit 2